MICSKQITTKNLIGDKNVKYLQLIYKQKGEV